MKRILAALAVAVVAAQAAAVEMGDDGLHKAAWMQDTFKDLREDLDEANDQDKRLLVLFEQRGCIYCTRMHEDVFPRPEIAELLSDRYFVVQMNLHGDTEITDFDGEALREKQAARKWGLMFTPTMMFFPEEVPEGVPAHEAAVAVMPGAFGPGTTLDLLTWVSEKRYEDQSGEDFQRYHARMIRERDDGSAD